MNSSTRKRLSSYEKNNLKKFLTYFFQTNTKNFNDSKHDSNIFLQKWNFIKKIFF